MVCCSQDCLPDDEGHPFVSGALGTISPPSCPTNASPGLEVHGLFKGPAEISVETFLVLHLDGKNRMVGMIPCHWLHDIEPGSSVEKLGRRPETQWVQTSRSKTSVVTMPST